MKGLVFDIQRFSLHDGPGIRTTVFLQGCPLNCFWCHNPEGKSTQPVLQFFDMYCIGCGDCMRVCPNGVHQAADSAHLLDRAKCHLCGKCVENCCSHALSFSSREMDAEAVVATVAQDKPFYERSSGGVTLSGGEPLLQVEFCLDILARCKAAGIHTALDTALFCEWERVERVLPYCDLILADLKTMDAAMHERMTGVSNEPILENLKRLMRENIPMIIRTPIIPTVNDGEPSVRAIAEFLKPHSNVICLELLAFHRLGEGKCRAIGEQCATSDLPQMERETLELLSRVAAESGVVVKGARS